MNVRRQAPHRCAPRPLTHHVHILEMNGDGYRLTHSKRRSGRPRPDAPYEAELRTEMRKQEGP
jgi:hypothetical protein